MGDLRKTKERKKQHRHMVGIELHRRSPRCAERGAVRGRACLSLLRRFRSFVLIAVCSTSVWVAAAPDNPYAGYTDTELAELAQSWADLDADQRRNYLVEMRRRMADTGKRTVPVNADARFGRVSESPGAVPAGAPQSTTVTEEGVVRQIVEPGRVTTESLVVRRSESGFGVGFERRVEIRGKRPERTTLGREAGHERPPPPKGQRPPPRDGRKPPPPRGRR